MRKRDKQVKFWLNEKEFEHFNKIVAKSGVSQAAYFRQLIYDLVPTDLPPPDYHAMMKQLYAIGNNLNQLAHRAHLLGIIDTAPYLEAVDALNKAVIEITDAVMRPRKIIRQV